MIRVFKKAELKALGLPTRVGGGKGCVVIANDIADQSRWSIYYDLIFRLDDQPESQAWSTGYSVGATEQQDEAPWENDDEIEATLVEAVEVKRIEWVPVKADGTDGARDHVQRREAYTETPPAPTCARCGEPWPCKSARDDGQGGT